jgi:hypothetical protein
MYTFTPTANIGSCYYLTASWKEADNTTSNDGGKKSGCGSVVGSAGVMASALLLVGAYRLLKKKED